MLFQRLNERSAYPGTGVGLAMCRKIIEYFGGRIWLDTAVTGSASPGGASTSGGATFRFTVPVISDNPRSLPTGGP